MKILQINVVYKIGSTGKIVYQIHKHLEVIGHKSYVIHGRGKRVSEPNVFKTSPDWDGKVQAVFARITGDLYGGVFLSTYRLIKRIKKIAPDIVHVHLMNGNYVNNYLLLTFLAKNKFKTVITVHAEVTYTGACEHSYECERWKIGCGHCPQVFSKYNSLFLDRTAEEWNRKIKAFDKFDFLTIVSVSDWLNNRVKQSPMFKGRNLVVIGNGIDTTIYKPVNPSKLKERLGIKNEKVILHVTPSFRSPSKGGEYVIEIAKRMRDKDVIVVIVGFDGYKEILPPNVIPIKHTDSQNELAQFYSLAHVTLLTSKLETFSMVCAESLSCGTPVLGFKAGAPEQIAVAEFSEFVDNGDVDALECLVIKWLNKDISSIMVQNCVNEKYSTLKMVNAYVKQYESLLKINS